ncbi:cell division protein SepF [Gemella sp. zg-570]|uniref:cell division protein SepF n=1 Tax=Gemella sp. zg-570 TaxID=2840371 RepID=UPI001C0DCAF5|nr:cell division protein SepF [Gemella sp. zg-570]QWQ38923.1 cell division protein SepF [Gemella sp. zg-570]
MSILKKFSSLLENEEDQVYDELDKDEIVEKKESEISRVQNNKSSRKVGISQGMAKKGDVVLVEPLVFADSKDVLDDIKANKVVILNLTKLDLETSDRLLDFISGGIYAMDAKLKTIGDEIYLCVPHGVDVEGEFSEGEY